MKDISEHILDIVQNSISAEATLIEIFIQESIAKNLLSLSIKDNGRGMSKEVLEKVTDAFYTSRKTRKVGLGIPLLKQNAELTGGNFFIESKIGIGTRLKADFIYDHIDKLPNGDISGSIVLLIASNPNLNFVYIYKSDKGEYVFDTREIKEVLGEVSITDNTVRKYLIEMISENVQTLK